MCMNKINNNKLITVLYMTDLVCLKEMTKFGHRIESANVDVHDYLTNSNKNCDK